MYEINMEGQAPIKIWASEVDDVTLTQLKNIAKLPFIFKHIAVMPDVHLGKGATVGSVIASKEAISPAAVGVDIGCGMLAVPLDKTIDEMGDLKKVFKTIEKVVPVGFSKHRDPQEMAILGTTASERVQRVWHSAPYQMGTLGGGNHFIEICDDFKGNAWLMLHSGSRGVGNQVAQVHINKAKALMKVWNIELADPDLAYLAKETPEFDEYLADLDWCQQYAMWNRRRMFKTIVKALRLDVNYSKVINCHHNYCLPDTELIPTPMGPKTITQLNEGDVIYSFDKAKGVVESRVKARWHSGQKKILRIKTDNRAIRVSEDHPILVIKVSKEPHPTRPWDMKTVGRYSWIEAKDLQPRDIIVCASDYYNAEHSIGSQKARFIGAFLGDGWLRKDTRNVHDLGLAIGGPSEVVTQRYLGLVQNLFPNANWKNNTKGAFGLSCTSKEVHSTIAEMGLTGRARGKRVSRELFTLRLEEKEALLSGYVDSDGCIDTKGAAKFASVNMSLVRDLREIAIACGYACTSLREEERHTNFGDGTIYSFQTSLHRHCGISPWHEEKARRLPNGHRLGSVSRLSEGLNTKKIGYLVLPSGTFAQRVRSINEDGFEDVYDIEVDHPSHSFICEGVVVHNCATESHFGEDVYVTRKGAVRAERGDLGIIPGSMGQASYIVRGKGNPESFNSCSHGAGRRFSRSKARKLFTVSDLVKQTAGVICRKDDGILDEIPAAYKEIDQVMNDQRELVEVVQKLKAVICVKG